ncbi:MAG: DUF4097 family beta strand repeat-containing protein [Prolixibacteraceae bacterium]|jgi:hypothetical protein
MKKLILVVVLSLGAIFSGLAQKVITKSLNVQDKKAEMKFDFADTIQIEAWNKNTIELEVTVNIDENKYNDYYALNVEDFGNSFDLTEKVDFEGIKKAEGKKNLCNFESEINYKLKVPADLEFSLKTISGKILLVGAKGKLTLNSVSGFIDYSIPSATKARINLSTVTGEVYSNVKFDNPTAEKMSWVGTKRDLSLNGGGTPVELKTVSGDIFLRKL